MEPLVLGDVGLGALVVDEPLLLGELLEPMLPEPELLEPELPEPMLLEPELPPAAPVEPELDLSDDEDEPEPDLLKYASHSEREI